MSLPGDSNESTFWTVSFSFSSDKKLEISPLGCGGSLRGECQCWTARDNHVTWPTALFLL